MNGLWLSDNNFVDFSSSLDQEMAVRSAFSSMGQWISILPDPDPILQKSGEGNEALESMAADYKVLSSLQTRKLKTLGRGAYAFSPGVLKGEEPSPEAIALCDIFTKDLERIDLYNLISEILDAPAYGMTVAELLWQSSPERMILKDIVPKPRKWFAFDTKNRLRLIAEYGFIEIDQGKENADEGWTSAGILPPYGKFILARHFPTYQNPYGLRLLSRCLFPVAFKRGGIEFMMRFAEKWGMPWIVGKASPKASQDEMHRMTDALAGMVQDAVAVVRGGSEVQIIETGTQAGDFHLSIVRHWDDAIAQVLMGQTLTSSVGEVGSYAAAKTHGDVLNEYAGADAVLVKTFFDEVAYTYTQINAPSAMSPVFSFEAPEDLAHKAELGQKLYDQGVQFTPEYFERHFNLATDEFIVKEKTSMPGAFFNSLANSPAQKTYFTPGQQSLDALVEELLPTGIKDAEKITGLILDQIDKADTPEELKKLLDKALGAESEGGIPLDSLTEAMEIALFAADMMGRFAGRENTE